MAATRAAGAETTATSAAASTPPTTSDPIRDGFSGPTSRPTSPSAAHAEPAARPASSSPVARPAPTPPPAPPSAQYPPPAWPAAAVPAHQGLTDPAYSAWWKRVCAALIDTVVVGIPGGIIFAVLGGSLVRTDPNTGLATFHLTGTYALACLLSLVLSLAYYVLLEGGPAAATVGKMAMNITLRDESTLTAIGYGRALGRRLLAAVLWWLFFIPGLLDVLWPLWDDRHQTLHDKATNSVVVDKA
ncbi:MAG TPA: RDD family protein [Acidimicrobiales bacterium]|nr:RDD family protein [Acidimicrobiales bacterium]